MKIKFIERLFGKNKRTLGGNSINLRTKLYMSFALLIVCMIVSSAAGINNSRKINLQSQSLYERNLKSVNILHRLRTNIFLDMNTAKDLAKFVTGTNIEQLENRTKEMDALIENFKTVADTKVNMDLLKQLETDYSSFKATKEDFLVYCKKKDANLEIFADLLKKSGDNINIVLEKLIRHNEEQAELANKSNVEVYKRAVSSFIIILIVVFGISLLISITISTNLAAQVRKVIIFTNMLKNKDFSGDIDIRGRDEFSKISGALMETKESLKEVMGRFNLMVVDTREASEDLSATIEEISSKMDEITSHTETIVKGVEHLSSLTEEVTSSALESNVTINNLSEKSQLGDKISMDIKKRAIDIKLKTNESLKASDELYVINQAQMSEEISRIIAEFKLI